MKCHYCENQATKTIVWLKDKKGKPTHLRLPWCGCDLMVALKKFWSNPYTVIEYLDYKVEGILDDRAEMVRYLNETLTDKQKEYLDILIKEAGLKIDMNM